MIHDKEIPLWCACNEPLSIPRAVAISVRKLVTISVHLRESDITGPHLDVRLQARLRPDTAVCADTWAICKRRAGKLRNARSL